MNLHFESRAIHVGSEPDPITGAVIPPLSLSTTFVQEAAGVHKGFEYSRSDNPTRKGFERAIASLENGKYGICPSIKNYIRPGVCEWKCDDCNNCSFIAFWVSYDICK